ncbi:KH domain-containing protein [Pseudofrankia sp. BMG5.36]|uniref:KH domain-containing protein n=1 Tax=Pseudofrankia sp. BMG5.36 TaxID=1834512 RepID=UPI0012FF9672|nr:KH domain-containing protein [Pseudofrankia sp. BMG5.36]
MTDDSAFKKQIRARMAETGEKYTVARRMVIAGRDPGQPPVVLRVYLSPHVDLELTAEAGRVYAAADEQGRREMAGRLLADQIEVAGFEEARVAAGSKIVTDQELRAEAEAAEDAAIRGAVQRGIERAVGLSAVEVGRAADRLRVDIRAARPILLAGQRGAEADRLRGEMEELTGRRVRLDIWEVPGPQEGPESEGSGRVG